MTTFPQLRAVAFSSFATALTLIGGMLLGGLGGSFLFEGLPGHLQEAAKIALASIPALAGGAVIGHLLVGHALSVTARAIKDVILQA
jgi:hypothetical protein